uniref:KEMP Eliminase n=1 Tax=Escherichia TaxID=561 RepID=UPI003D81C6D6
MRVTGVLREIVAHLREEIAERKRRVPLDELRARAASAPPPLDFLAALRGPRIRLIACIVGADPSVGAIRPEFDPAAIARSYEKAGAAAIGVFTIEDYFRGSDEYLQQVRAAVSLPVLRIDFIIDPYQVYEARALGADAILLLAAILSPAQLRELMALAHELGMAAMVEVTDEEDVERALAAKAPLIVIINLNWDTLEISLETTRRLRQRIPPGITVVTWGGIHTREQVEEMEKLGVHAFMVMVALMRAPDPAAKVRELLGIGR